MSLHLDPDPRAQSGPGVEPLFDDDADPSQFQPPADPTPTLRVTAVLVAHDGASFLPRTLDAIEAQSRRPNHLIAVDAGSQDGGGALLALATGRVLRLNRDTSFGDAVQAALIALDGGALVQAADPRPAAPPVIQLPAQHAQKPSPPVLQVLPGEPSGVQWLWLLHDDSAPAPDALERLIEAVDSGPSIGIAGCKQVSWDDGRRLLDVGFTTSRLGARVTGIDVDDLDQGQLDHRSDVMAVGTAGMLVRRDVWDQLGGPDPVLAHARDDLDLCRRAHLAGLRVVVVPAAVIAHATATASGRRGTDDEAARARASWALWDRTAAVHLRLAAVPLLLLPFLVIWLAGAALLRALARLALKQPQRAVAELAAYGRAVTRPLAWLRARRRARAHRKLPRREFRRLLAGSGQALRQRRDALSSYLRTQEQAWSVSAAEGSGGQLAIAQPPVEIDQDAVGFDEEPARPRRRPGTRIGAAVAAVVGVAGLIGLRLLLAGTGVPLGPALIPAPQRAGQLWQLAMSGWRPSGLGVAAVADPFDAVLAMIAWPLGGSTGQAAEVLLLGALPLSALVAWWAAGGVTRSRALRAWAALGWAAAPSLLSAVAAGRLAAIVAHLALPAAGLALTRATGFRPAAAPGEKPSMATAPGRGRGSISAASWAGLLITVVIAAAPSLALPCLAAVLMVAVLYRPGRGLIGWAAAVPVALLLPWWIAVAQHPGLLLAEPGGASAAEPGTGGWPAALWPADPATIQHGPAARLARFAADLSSVGNPAGWLRAAAIALAVPLLALGLSALLRSGRRRLAGGLWMVGLSGLAVAVLAPVLDTRGADGVVLHGWPGAGSSLLTLMVLAAALVRLDGSAVRLRARSLGVRHGLAVVLGLVAVLAPVLIVVGWAADGWTASATSWVHRGSADVIPAVAADEAGGPAATRTLVLRLTPDGVRWSLYRAGGPRLGQDSAASTGSGAGPVLSVIGGLLSDSGADQREQLANLDIGSVLLLAADKPDAEAVLAALDSSPGFQRIATPAGAVLWGIQLDDGGVAGAPTRPARVRVLAADGRMIATLPSAGLDVHAQLKAGPRGRILVLAERADPGWQARLNGRPLQPIEHAGWAQAFLLPTAGGVITVRHVVPGQPLTDGLRLIVLGLALLVAVPLPRRRPRLLPPPRSAFSRTPPVPVENVGRRARLPRQAGSPVQESVSTTVAVLQPLIPPIWDDVDPADQGHLGEQS